MACCTRETEFRPDVVAANYELTLSKGVGTMGCSVCEKWRGGGKVVDSEVVAQ